MPMYTQLCKDCDSVVVKISSIETRDEQACDTCGTTMQRQIDRPGMVWSPTKNGGYSF